MTHFWKVFVHELTNVASRLLFKFHQCSLCWQHSVWVLTSLFSFSLLLIIIHRLGAQSYIGLEWRGQPLPYLTLLWGGWSFPVARTSLCPYWMTALLRSAPAKRHESCGLQDGLRPILEPAHVPPSTPHQSHVWVDMEPPLCRSAWSDATEAGLWHCQAARRPRAGTSDVALTPHSSCTTSTLGLLCRSLKTKNATYWKSRTT